MAVSVAVTRVACDTSTGDQDITIAGFGTPKAAMFFWGTSTTDATATADFVYGMGAATSTSARWTVCFTSDDNLSAASNTYNRHETGSCVHIINANDGSVDAVADFVAWITDGVRINWSNAPTAANLLTVVLFGGTDLSAHAGSPSMGNATDNVVDVTAPGFEPNLVFTAASTNIAAGTSAANAWGAVGMVSNDGAAGIVQRCQAFNVRDNRATSESYVSCRSDYGIMMGTNTATLDWGGDFGTFDANGFSITTRNAGGNNQIANYLALGMGGAANALVMTHSTPTSIGNDGDTGAGFTPQAVFMLTSQMAAVNTSYNAGDTATTLGFSVITDAVQYSNSASDEDGVGTTNAQSLTDDKAVHLPDDDGTAGIEGAYVSLDATGWTTNYTAVKGAAALFWAAAIEGVGGAAAVDVDHGADNLSHWTQGVKIVR